MELIYIILLVMIVALIISLLVEIYYYSKFIAQRDLIIETIANLQKIVNINAATQEKMRAQIISDAQEIDLIEKVLGVHALALKIIGPSLLKVEDIDLDKIAEDYKFLEK